MPPQRDFGFYRRRKHDKWEAVEAPALEGPVADSHAHIHMLPDPAWELSRCAANGVDYVCMFVDPADDGPRPFEQLEAWRREAGEQLLATGCDVPPEPVRVCIAVGVHPHNATLYTPEVENELLARLNDSRVGALGEIGLDYYYDLSPRDAQRDVFRRQIRLAKQLELPVALHLRGGKDPDRDDAHAEAFAILQDEGFPQAGTLLHCCTLSPDQLRPWIEADCYVAFGGAVTFNAADDAREGVRLVPSDRLLFETDSPYMTPEPMRGTTCTPAHVVFTAASIAETRGVAPGPDRRAFLRQVHDNTERFYRYGTTGT